MSYQPARPAKEATLNTRILVSAALLLSLSACDGDEAATQQEKSFGGQLGDSYKGMLDEAKQGVEHTNEHVQRTEQAVRERNQ